MRTRSVAVMGASALLMHSHRTVVRPGVSGGHVLWAHPPIMWGTNLLMLRQTAARLCW